VNQNDISKNDPLLNEPVAEIPKVDPEFYIDEFLRWLSDDIFNTYESDKIEIDYKSKHKELPRLMYSEPEQSEWDPILIDNLKITHRGKIHKGKGNISDTHIIFLTNTLSAIKQNFELFIEKYASFLQLRKLLESSKNNIYEGEMMLINRLSNKLLARNRDEKKQLIPKLYHYRDHGCLMSVSLENVNKLDVKIGEEVYEYGFSKTSSDNFLIVLNEILKERLITLQNTNNPDENRKKFTSYLWINTPNHHWITELGNSLSREGFIDGKTKMTDFKSIFTGKINHPVNWIGESCLTEILYLFYLLWEDERYKWVEKPKQPYKNLVNCFLFNGKTLTQKYLITKGNVKNIYSSIKLGNYRPARAEEIRKILIKVSEK